jgi:vacuolar-type H+-ATPase subunit H
MSAKSTQPSAVSAEGTAPRRPWWVWLIGAAFLVVGAAVIVAGGRISGLSEYERSIFAHIGTAVGLIGPLFVAERLLSIRVTEARDEANAARSAAGEALETAKIVRETVDDLDREVRDQLAQLRDEDEQRAQRAAQGSFQDLVDQYNQVATQDWVDRRGLRIPAGGDLWLLVRAVRRAPEGGEAMWLIELTYEGPSLERIGSAIWSPGEPAVDVFLRLATELKRAGKWPGEESFRPTELLTDIAETLGMIIDSHTGALGDRRLRQVLEVVGEDWAVTREGLDSLHKPDIYAESRELRGDSNSAFHRLKGLVERQGLDEAAFLAAFANAEHIHAGLRAESNEIFAKLGRKWS